MHSVQELGVNLGDSTLIQFFGAGVTEMTFSSLRLCCIGPAAALCHWRRCVDRVSRVRITRFTTYLVAQRLDRHYELARKKGRILLDKLRCVLRVVFLVLPSILDSREQTAGEMSASQQSVFQLTAIFSTLVLQGGERGVTGTYVTAQPLFGPPAR